MDDRALQLGAGGDDTGGGNNGSGSSGGRANNSSGSPGSGATAEGGSPAVDVTIPVCDYSADVAEDCVTLAKNPGFAKDTTQWDPDGGVFPNWRELDASDAKDSGSMDVINTLAGEDNGVAPGSARQCLPATPGHAYDLAADVYVEDGQGDGKDPGGPYEGSAILGAFFFDAEDCNGTSVGFVNAKPVTESGKWTHVSVTGIAPGLTKAISVRLNALKPIREFTFKATFDNVFVRER